MKMYAFLLVLLFFIPACGTGTATVLKTDGSVVEADITDGNYKTLYMTKDGSDLIQIDRAEIADIDHPGNVHIVVGSFLTLVGVSAIVFGGTRKAQLMRRRLSSEVLCRFGDSQL